MSAAPRRPLNPLLRRCVDRSGKPKWAIALAAGFPHYPTFYAALHAEMVPATPLMVKRLEDLADFVGFPKAALFLDEVVR